MKLAPLPLVVLLAMVSWASGQVTDGQWTYVIEDGGATITESTASGAVTIPSELGGYAVKIVRGKYWYGAYISIFGYSNTSVTSVSIPDSVSSIGEGTFYGGTGLTSVNIPDSVSSIGEGAFYGATGLTSVNIPNSVSSIGEGAFNNCTGLTSVVIPSRFTAQIGAIGFTGQLATDLIADGLVEAIAQRVIAALPDNYGIATKADLSGAITDAITTATSTLATKAEITTAINEGKASGIASVTAAPNTWSLFTTSQIQNMAVGDLVLTRQVGGDGDFVLNYDIEQSEDLVNWTPYQALSLPLTGLPTDKAFIRIRAK